MLVPAESGVHTTFVVSLKVVPALTSGDAEPLLRLVAEAESLGGGLDPLTSELLGEIGRLVPADWIAYNELDRVRRRNLFIVGWPCEDDDDDGELSDEDWELQLEHPTCLRHQQGFSKLKVSDFFTQRELHGTRLYQRPVSAGGNRVRNDRCDSFALVAYEDILFFRRGPPRFQRARPARPQPSATAPRSPLAGGTDTSTAQGSARKHGSRVRA